MNVFIFAGSDDLYKRENMETNRHLKYSVSSSKWMLVLMIKIMCLDQLELVLEIGF